MTDAPSTDVAERDHSALLLERLLRHGYAVRAFTPASGGVVATAGLVRLASGVEVFAKTLPGQAHDVFTVEAEGLRILRERGGVRTPDVVAASDDLLILEPMGPHRDEPAFWEELGRSLAVMHTSTVNDRFGWYQDGWLGRMRQDNTWDDDGHEFFAQRRILRWLPEPLVEAAFDSDDRRALERLCEALPDLVPAQPPVLTHGDLWSQNVVADRTGAPVLIDPAVSFTWAEVDLSMLWCSPRPPSADRFFDAYAEATWLREGWQNRMQLLNLRELLSTIAHGDDNWGAANLVREIVAPFTRRLR